MGPTAPPRLDTVTSRADLKKNPSDVSGMFDLVAPAYDRTNSLLSFGLDKNWRDQMVAAVDPRPGQRVLDIACGTGVSSVALAVLGAEVVGADFSPGMIAEAEKLRGGTPGVTFQIADATDLPFANDEFDAVTISYGLRNVVDTEKALEEFLRVTRPGGRLVICEFSTPPNTLFRTGYRFYNDHILPLVAKVASSNPEAYSYLNESIRDWPDQRALSALLREAGWRDVAYRNLAGGIVALHRATKPGVGSAGTDTGKNRPVG